MEQGMHTIFRKDWTKQDDRIIIFISLYFRIFEKRHHRKNHNSYAQTI